MDSLETTAAAGLLEVQVPASKAVWLLVGPVFIISGLAGASIVRAGRASFQGIPQTVFIVGAGLTIAASVLIANKLWQRRIEAKAMCIARDHPDAPVRELIHRMFRKGAWLGPALYWLALARALSKFNRVGVTIRSFLPKHTNPIEPITVTFEPRLLDEADESVVALESAVDSANNGAHDAADPGRSDKEPSPTTRRLRRSLRMAGGWLAVTPVTIFLIAILWDTISTARISFIRMASLGMFVTLLGMGLLASTQEWLIVPGGVLIRKGRLLSSESQLRLIDRRNGVLVAHRLRKHHWFVCVADADETIRTIVTPHEATLLLRTWLSPIQPPPLERLSDLGQST